jgi:hypothetical protein
MIWLNRVPNSYLEISIDAQVRCDKCRKKLYAGEWFHHCEPCSIDICENCRGSRPKDL